MENPFDITRLNDVELETLAKNIADEINDRKLTKQWIEAHKKLEEKQK